MTYQLAISPDVHARDLPAWFVFNTRLQRALDAPMHATIYDDFGALHSAYDSDRVDLVYANAADTVRLVRDHGYLPLAIPRQVVDEAVVVVAADSGLTTLDDLPERLSVAATDAPDVERICRILLEPADLGADHLELKTMRNYVLVAKAVLNQTVQAGFFLRKAYDSLSEVTRVGLYPLISSKIYVVTHCFLVNPRSDELVEPMQSALSAMGEDPGLRELLANLGAPSGWQRTSDAEVEFMVDLMDALQQ